jgi:hypothetical protein
MRSIFLFLLSFIISTSALMTMAGATALMPDKKLTYQKHKEYISEAQQAYKSCEQNPNYATAYNCKCIATKFYETRKETDNFFKHSQILKDALPDCKSAPKLANHYYNQCTSWAAPTRKDAHEFCQCYGNAMGRNFQKQTFQSARATEGIMTMAMSECDLRSSLRESRQREKSKEKLKKRGWFERLFPEF